jgi:outer membrane receptor for ferrienterochelin and colicins
MNSNALSSARRRRLASRLLIAASVALSPIARFDDNVCYADGVADEADLHFQIAAEHYQKGEFRDALEHFLFSNRLVPNKNVVFNIARTYEQLKRYADAHRYYVDALAVETREQTVADLNAAIKRIAPNVAVLRIASSPPGATIYIDRRDLGSRGRAPKPLALVEGKYNVIAELEGHEPVTIEGVELKLGTETPLEVKLKRIVGTVHVTVEGAPDADVHVDDEKAEPVCKAPCDAQLPPGQHLLYFSRPGFQAAPRQVTIVARGTVAAKASLSPLTGSVVVSADEREALVEVDGKAMGFTPAVIQNVAVGKRRVRVSLRGFAPVEQEINVKTNEQAQLIDLRLTPVRQVAAASRFAESIDDAPSSVSVIDGQEIQAFGYPTLAEALRGVRGISLSSDRVYSSIGIRGLGEPNDYGNRLLVLSDGQPLNDNLLNSSYVGSDARADLHDVERLEVIRGPGSLLYGTGAFSGVVNIVPRGKEAPNSVHGSLGTYDNGVARGRAGFHYNFTPKVGMWASVSGARSDGVDVPVALKDPGDGLAVQTANGVETFRSGGTAGRFWAGPFAAQWLFHTRAQQLPTGAAGALFNDARTTYRDTRWMAELRYEPKLTEQLQLMTRFHANRYTFGGDYAYDPAPAAPTREDYYGTWFGLEARLVYTPRPWLRLTAGGEGQLHPQATMEGGFPNDVYLDSRTPYRFGAGYALAEASPTAWFRVSAGARLDVYSTFGPIFVPRVAFIFKPPNSGGVLKIMGGRAFRAPSVYEQHYTDGQTQVAAVDPSRGLTLGPESVYTGEIEYSQHFKEDWVALLAGHVNHVQGIINTISDSGAGGLARYANSDVPALTAGGEVELRKEWRQGWMLGANYSYERAQFLDGSLANPRLINAPEHFASLRGVVPMVADLASLGVRTTLEAPRRIDQTSDDLTRLAVVADLTVSGAVKRFGLSYVLGVYNVLDARYENPVSLVYLSRTVRQTGRTFLANVTVTYP